MTAWAALVVLAAPVLAGSSVEPCIKSYQDSYAADWSLGRQAWDAGCRAGQDAEEILTQAQRQSMADCGARFAPYEGKKLAVGQSAALCAQGAEGRARLEEMTGTAKPKAPPSAPAASLKPGDSNFGPLSAAVRTARSLWKPDACFSGLYYDYIESVFISAEEWESAKKAGRTPRMEPVDLEEYAYYFRSGDDDLDAYRVSYGDDLDPTFCHQVKRMDGPDSQDAPPKVGFETCVGDVDVDISSAMAVARAHGFHDVGAPFRAYLVSLPPGYFGRLCSGKNDSNGPVRCDLFREWDQGRLRRVTGHPVWALSSREQTAFVDARRGRFRFLGDGPFDMHPAKSFKYAEPCEMDPGKNQSPGHAMP